MELSILTAISPIDGRYRNKTEKLDGYFSEWALMQYRVRVETEYFIFLTEILPQLKALDRDDIKNKLRSIYQNFTLRDSERIKEIESITNHDVKAVEYFIKEHFSQLKLDDYKEFIHFGLTSQDVNNTSVPLSIQEALHDIVFPMLDELLQTLKNYAEEWSDIAMLARTHGQPASPTRLGKEINVFSYRLGKQIDVLRSIPLTAKFGGATGNFNAHHAAYPQLDWKKLADSFVYERLGLQREQFTTQISNYDTLAALFDAMKRINVILTDLCRDMWTYISLDYFHQQIKEDEVGSSAMPHKVNPIDFENAEGNLGVANALFEFLSAKLPVSRLQRDLTDSTTLRNVGVAFAHSVLAFSSLSKGLGKLRIDKETISRDLENNWAVVAEAIQTILRRERFPNPYEQLKALTRGNREITKESIASFIDSLDATEQLKKELMAVTPWNYTGI